MAYVDELLGRGEQVLYVARQHILVLISRVLTGLALIAVLVAAGVVSNIAFNNNTRLLGIEITGRELLFGLFVISAFVLASIFSDFLRWNAAQYVLTDRRIIQISGVFSRETLDSSLDAINDFALRQSPLGRLFNYGTIEIMGTGNEPVNTMENVAAPLAFKRAMLEAKHNYDQGYGYLRRQIPALAAHQPVLEHFDVHRTLEELARLHDRGILSIEEFEAKKRELLNRI